MNKTHMRPGDIGVYVTFSLFFAGLGLVIGSYIASRKQQKEYEDIPLDGSDVVVNPIVKYEQEDFLVEAAVEIVKDPEWHPTPEWLNAYELIIDNYVVNDDIHAELLGGGVELSDIEQVLRDMGAEKKPNYGHVKPDLEAGVEVDEDPDPVITRYQITKDRPTVDGKKKPVILEYDTEEDRLLRVMGEKRIAVDDPEAMVGEKTIDSVLNFLIFQDVDFVYILDTQENRTFKIKLYEPKMRGGNATR